MNSLIYKISFPETIECYIGSTQLSLRDRMYNHLSDNRSHTKAKKTCVGELFWKYGSSNAKIELIEDLGIVDKLIRWEREAYWIMSTEGCVNILIPQGKETNQGTEEGRKAYMNKYYQEHKDQYKKYYNPEKRQAYLQRPEIKKKNAERSAENRIKFAEKIKKDRNELIICPKCGLKTSRGNKWRHDATCEEKMKEKEERKKDYDMLVELRKTMTFRAIVLHEYFQGRTGYKNHQSLQKLEKDFLSI